MKIHYLSDWHVDSKNPLNAKLIKENLVPYLDKNFDYDNDRFIIAGDVSNDIKISVNWIKKLEALRPKVKGYFVIGNHELCNNDTRYRKNKYKDTEDIYDYARKNLNGSIKLLEIGKYYDEGNVRFIGDFGGNIESSMKRKGDKCFQIYDDEWTKDHAKKFVDWVKKVYDPKKINVIVSHIPQYKDLWGIENQNDLIKKEGKYYVNNPDKITYEWSDTYKLLPQKNCYYIYGHVGNKSDWANKHFPNHFIAQIGRIKPTFDVGVLEVN